MITSVKEKFWNLIKQQGGMALPAVIALFAVGSLMIVPSINYVATNIKAGSMAEEEFKGILAADGGVEDALWKIKNDPPESLPYSYQIADINGLSVDVEIDEIDTLAGEPIPESGDDAAWLALETAVIYDYELEHYLYTLAASNNGSGNIKIEKILIAFPSGVDYVPDSTSSNLTNPLNGNPTSTSGSSATGITLVWANGTPRPTIGEEETEYHCFQLDGPPGIEGIEGNGFVKAKRENIGTVWLGDVLPYSIIAQAKDASETVIASIRAGVWGSSDFLEISCWQVIH